MPSTGVPSAGAAVRCRSRRVARWAAASSMGTTFSTMMLGSARLRSTVPATTTTRSTWSSSPQRAKVSGKSTPSIDPARSARVIMAILRPGSRPRWLRTGRIRVTIPASTTGASAARPPTEAVPAEQ